MANRLCADIIRQANRLKGNSPDLDIAILEIEVLAMIADNLYAIRRTLESMNSDE
jgi:hypothetical protein